MNYVLDILLAVAFGFSILTLILGLFMLIVPDKIHSLAARLDVTISTEKYFSILDNTKHIDRYFYKYHYIFGIFIIAGAVYTVFILAGSENFYQALPEIVNPVVSEWLYDAFILILIIINSFAILIGCIVLIRPSVLKAFETKMNSWIGTAGLIQQLDSPRMMKQQKPLKWPRLYGMIIIIGSIYILWQTAPQVF